MHPDLLSNTEKVLTSLQGHDRVEKVLVCKVRNKVRNMTLWGTGAKVHRGTVCRVRFAEQKPDPSGSANIDSL